eukprot:3515560-Pleurochrysis_carterae.AAC.1
MDTTNNDQKYGKHATKTRGKCGEYCGTTRSPSKDGGDSPVALLQFRVTMHANRYEHARETAPERKETLRNASTCAQTSVPSCGGMQSPCVDLKGVGGNTLASFVKKARGNTHATFPKHFRANTHAS